MSTIYEQLCEPFAQDETFTLRKGGAELTYVTGEAVATRLNTVLGVDGWSFELAAQGQDDKHCWAHGRLTAYLESRTVVREQFGETGITGGMSAGDARKGAATDALKKCASLLGVGLYLSHKAEHAQQAAEPRQPTPLREADLSAGCVDCQAPLTPWKLADGGTWTAQEAARYARNKFGRVLCWKCVSTLSG